MEDLEARIRRIKMLLEGMGKKADALTSIFNSLKEDKK